MGCRGPGCSTARAANAAGWSARPNGTAWRSGRSSAGIWSGRPGRKRHASRPPGPRSLDEGILHVQLETTGRKLMKTPETANPSGMPLSQDLLHAARSYLGGFRGLIVLAAGIPVPGATLNWRWLVAAGCASLLLRPPPSPPIV